MVNMNVIIHKKGSRRNFIPSKGIQGVIDRVAFAANAQSQPVLS